MRTRSGITHEMVKTVTVDEVVIERGDDTYELYQWLGRADSLAEVIDFSIDDDGNLNLLVSQA